jgi:glycosyltransferase involved in cell wall biosynthesis
VVKFLYITRVPITAVGFIFPLAHRLRERGNLVEFAFGPGNGLKEVEQSGFPFTMLEMDKNSRSLRNIGVVDKLSKIIKRGDYDVVHTYSPVIGIYGRFAAYKAKAPVIIHSVIGSVLASGVPFSDRLMYFLSELATSRMVDLFITLNDTDARAMVKYRLASAQKVVSLKYEYGVNLKEFNPEIIDSSNLKSIRTKLGLEEGTPVIGFVGRMIGAKGILDLFEAYRLIRANGIRAKLLYVGDVLSTDKDGESFGVLKTMVKDAGLEDDVIFLGFQDDVPFNISLMDVVVHPSHHEGFPRIPIEAGAMRKPSVCTAVSGAEVAVENGETGFIVPIRDPARLSNAIETIISNPALALEMGNKARQRVVKLFDQDNIVDQQIRIYQEFFLRKKAAANYVM